MTRAHTRAHTHGPGRPASAAAGISVSVVISGSGTFAPVSRPSNEPNGGGPPQSLRENVHIRAGEHTVNHRPRAGEVYVPYRPRGGHFRGALETKAKDGLTPESIGRQNRAQRL